MNNYHQPAWREGAKAITRVTTQQWYIVFNLGQVTAVGDALEDYRKEKYITDFEIWNKSF